MNKAFNAVIQFNKCAIIGNIGYPAGHFAIELKFGRCFIPWVSFQLLHAQADTLGFSIDFYHLHTHRLADGQNL